MSRAIIAGLPAAEYYRQHYQKQKQDPEFMQRRAEHNRTYRRRHADQAKATDRRRYLRTKYGMTPEEYDALLLKQGGACASCGCLPDTRYGKLYVDHDHATGVVRGLLCNACNVSLGHLKDDPDRMRRLIDYISRP